MTDYYLFANPSFLSGMASVLDLGCTLNEYNVSLSPEQADLLGIKSDWEVVGHDIRFAMAKYEKEISPSGTKKEK